MTRNDPEGQQQPFDILLVEPNPDDISPVIDSFEATEVTDEVHIVSDGNQALDFIHQRGDYDDAPQPDLILLDIHLPGRSGDEILEELNKQSELQRIPVIVLTTSDSAEDVARMYELNANAYVKKPDTSSRFAKLAQAIEDFWLKTAHLPPK